MNRRWMLAAAALVALAFWLYFWCQPERQVRRAQGRLLAAAESGDFDSFAKIIAADYRDVWGQDKAFVLKRAQLVFSNFGLLSIGREDHGLVDLGGKWELREKITMRGLGGPLAIAVRDRVNRLQTPFVMSWRKSGGAPWDWELVSIEHPEISQAEVESGGF